MSNKLQFVVAVTYNKLKFVGHVCRFSLIKPEFADALINHCVTAVNPVVVTLTHAVAVYISRFLTANLVVVTVNRVNATANLVVMTANRVNATANLDDATANLDDVIVNHVNVIANLDDVIVNHVNVIANLDDEIVGCVDAITNFKSVICRHGDALVIDVGTASKKSSCIYKINCFIIGGIAKPVRINHFTSNHGMDFDGRRVIFYGFCSVNAVGFFVYFIQIPIVGGV